MKSILRLSKSNLSINSVTKMEINKELIQQLFDQAVMNPRKRQNLDLRTSAEDNSQRMLKALMPGTEVPIHRHPLSNENVLQNSPWQSAGYSGLKDPKPLFEGELISILYQF